MRPAEKKVLRLPEGTFVCSKSCHTHPIYHSSQQRVFQRPLCQEQGLDSWRKAGKTDIEQGGFIE